MAKKIIVSIVVFIVTFVAAGVVMELLKTQKQESARYFRTRNVFQYQPGNVRFNPILGYAATPGLDVAFNNIEFNTNIRTNQLGFRDDAYSIISATIIFLGDSYVWGWGVEEQQGVEKQYERITGQTVLNTGVPGYGNVQELLLLYMLQRMMPLEGKHIYLFFCANDLLDNQNTSFGLFPYFINGKNGPEFSHPDEAGFKAWQAATDKWTVHNSFAKRSMLWYYLSAAIKNIQTKDLYRDYETTTDKLNGIQAFLLVANALSTIQQQAHAKVSIVYIPPAAYYEQGAVDRSSVIVKQACEKLQLQFLDLSHVLNKDDYYRMDKHWKASAHKKAAEFLAAHQ